jgi:hypothetical protein
MRGPIKFVYEESQQGIAHIGPVFTTLSLLRFG